MRHRTVLRTCLTMLVVLGCRTSPTSPPLTTGDAGAQPAMLVRIHRYGGGFDEIDHTLTVFADATFRLEGYDTQWCPGVSRAHPLDLRGAVPVSSMTKLRSLVADPAVRAFPSAKPPAHAPDSDSVAAEVSLPDLATILVDGLDTATGKMDRLLDLDRRLAEKLATASCP